MKFRLVTFADGSFSWKRTAHRLERQALKSGWFSKVELYDLDRISIENPVWSAEKSQFIHRNPRGLGFWIWKPEIARLQLADLGPDELGIIYLDAGFSLNFEGEASGRFSYYESLVSNGAPLFFQLKAGNEWGKWVKNVTSEYFARNGYHLGDSRLVVGGAFILPKGSVSQNILRAWSELMDYNKHELLTDALPESDENPNFVEHRHDQALLTGIILSMDPSEVNLLQDETYFDGHWSGVAKKFPLLATRLRSGFNSTSSSILWKIVRKIERNIADNRRISKFCK